MGPETLIDSRAERALFGLLCLFQGLEVLTPLLAHAPSLGVKSIEAGAVPSGVERAESAVHVLLTLTNVRLEGAFGRLFDLLLELVGLKSVGRLLSLVQIFSELPLSALWLSVLGRNELRLECTLLSGFLFFYERVVDFFCMPTLVQLVQSLKRRFPCGLQWPLFFQLLFPIANDLCVLLRDQVPLLDHFVFVPHREDRIAHGRLRSLFRHRACVLSRLDSGAGDRRSHSSLLLEQASVLF